ncbi:alkaline phosphatase PhoX [Actinophytocola sp.]|uniref:alkaline phosphatase PhoX n=1 Tax=Actinophytocola sp. TaxID=1872138 RepID=UPI003D6C0066
MERRSFLKVSVAGAAAAAFGGASWSNAFSANAAPGDGPYGPLLPADGNGLALPHGFTGRVIARSLETVADTSYRWHMAPDGGACFADGDGWIYVSNSEVPFIGGAGAVRFGPDGSIVDAYRILDGTDVNCAGGKTPWNTWLSCEEVDKGEVYETDPFGVNDAIVRPAMGRFKHEACAVDPDRQVIYLTEDVGDGGFYRFTPATWPALSAGTLEIMVGPADQTSGAVTWAQVPDPSADDEDTRHQVEGSKPFDGGEGCFYANGTCWFTTKGDNRVWAYDAAASTISLTYDDDTPLSGVDNVTGASSGDLFVAEDGDNMEICVITPDGVVAPFVRVEGHDESEITGPAFSPDGTRLYFSSQRGTGGEVISPGMTFEVTGPFRS